MARRVKKDVAVRVKESEKLLMTQIAAVEELYFFRTGEENMRFTDELRKELRRVIRKYGVGGVLAAVNVVVDKYGDDGLDKLIAIAICLSDPKKRANYICGIIKNKLGVNIDTHDTTTIKQLVSDIVERDSGKSDAIDYVVEAVKNHDFDYIDDYIDTIRYFGEHYFHIRSNS